MCLTCDVLQLRSCPRPVRSYDAELGLHLERDLDAEAVIHGRRARDRNQHPAPDALIELILQMQLRPQWFGPSWELGRRQN